MVRGVEWLRFVRPNVRAKASAKVDADWPRKDHFYRDPQRRGGGCRVGRHLSEGLGTTCGAELRELGTGLCEQCPKQRAMTAVLVLTVAANREVCRVGQGGQQIDVVFGSRAGHFSLVLASEG